MRKDLVIKFLKELSDRFSNDGCNDFYLKNTVDNRQLIRRAQEWADPTDGYDWPKDNGKKLLTSNILILDYLIHQLENE